VICERHESIYAKKATQVEEVLKMDTNKVYVILLSLVFFVLTGCATSIKGSVTLMEDDMKVVSDEELEGIIVNVINTSSDLENASYTLTTDYKGEFHSKEGQLPVGTYKIEVGHKGYQTTTKTVEINSFSSPKIKLDLVKLPNAPTRTIRSNSSDRDKIINPGEVSIQPPLL